MIDPLTIYTDPHSQNDVCQGPGLKKKKKDVSSNFKSTSVTRNQYTNVRIKEVMGC